MADITSPITGSTKSTCLLWEPPAQIKSHLVHVAGLIFGCLTNGPRNISWTWMWLVRNLSPTSRTWPDSQDWGYQEEEKRKERGFHPAADTRLLFASLAEIQDLYFYSLNNTDILQILTSQIKSNFVLITRLQIHRNWTFNQSISTSWILNDLVI